MKETRSRDHFPFLSPFTWNIKLYNPEFEMNIKLYLRKHSKMRQFIKTIIWLFFDLPNTNKKKTFFFSKFFSLLPTFPSFFKDKKIIKKSHKTIGIKVFLTIFAR